MSIDQSKSLRLEEIYNMKLSIVKCKMTIATVTEL